MSSISAPLFTSCVSRLPIPPATSRISHGRLNGSPRVEDLGPGSKLRENAITDGGCAALAVALRGGALPALRPLHLNAYRTHAWLHCMCTRLHTGTAYKQCM